MRIAIDARAYFQRTGIGRYTRELLRALVSTSGPTQYLLLISDHHQPGEIPFGDPRVEVRVSRAPWLAGAAESAVLGDEARRWAADLFHAIFPPVTADGVRSVVTLFDLVPLNHPELHPEQVVRVFGQHWARSSQNAAAFVAISEGTALQARRLVGDSIPVHVTGCGLSAPFDEPIGKPDARAGVLFVGTNEPRKNLRVVFDAVRLLQEQGRSVPLTVIGKQGWTDFRPEQAAAGLSGIRCLGFVSDSALLSEYRRAKLLVMPSAVEGFGLPVLEAMAQGALPLVSQDPSLAELVPFPDLAVPIDAAALAAAIARWLDDDSARAERTSLLSQMARSRTWRQVAERWRAAHEACR